MTNNLAITSEKRDGVLTVTAPSNIALIKYMGLSNHENKIPANASLSYTIKKAVTTLKVSENNEDLINVPLGKDRYQAFYKILKNKFSIAGTYSINSENNFPSACGIASSAASFAALTAAMATLAQLELNEDIATLSRFGSGSACRSFFNGWVEWREDQVYQQAFPFNDLEHAVLLLDTSRKKISSSTAHKMVESSPNFKDRIINVEKRLKNLKYELINKNWQNAGLIIKEEYLDMHKLFKTCWQGFSYRSDLNQKIEGWCEQYNIIFGIGPWVTLDAGPNIHLLFQDKVQKTHFLKEFSKKFPNIEVYQ